jgi:hypothetical protein
MKVRSWASLRKFDQTNRRGLVPKRPAVPTPIHLTHLDCPHPRLPGQVRSYRVRANPVGGDLSPKRPAVPTPIHLTHLDCLHPRFPGQVRSYRVRANPVGGDLSPKRPAVPTPIHLTHLDCPHPRLPGQVRSYKTRISFKAENIIPITLNYSSSLADSITGCPDSFAVAPALISLSTY